MVVNFANPKYVNSFVLHANCLGKTWSMIGIQIHNPHYTIAFVPEKNSEFYIELVIVANLLMNFKYGNLFEEMEHWSRMTSSCSKGLWSWRRFTYVLSTRELYSES